MEYRESQKFNQWWLWLLNLALFLGAVTIGYTSWTGGGDPVSSAAIPLVMAVTMILLATIELRTVITDEGLEVKFWPFGRRRIFKSEIKRAHVRKYSPLKEYGGWGYRVGPRGKAFNMQGNMGLQLEMKDGDKLLIGTRKPEELAAWIEGWLASSDDGELTDEMVTLKLKELEELEAQKLLRGE